MPSNVEENGAAEWHWNQNFEIDVSDGLQSQLEVIQRVCTMIRSLPSLVSLTRLGLDHTKPRKAGLYMHN